MARSVGIQMPGYAPKEPSNMDKILQGVQIANAIIQGAQGIKTLVSPDSNRQLMDEQAKLLEAQRYELARKSGGVINPVEAYQMGLVPQSAGNIQQRPTLNTGSTSPQQVQQRYNLPTQMGGKVQNVSYQPIQKPVDVKEELGIQKSLSDLQQSKNLDKASSDNINDQLNSINAFENLKAEAPKFEKKMGPLERFTPSIIDQYINSPEYLAFKSSAGAALDVYKKAMMGTRGGEEIIKNAEKRVPTEKDLFPSFMAKADARIKEAKSKILEEVLQGYYAGKTQELPPAVNDILYEQLNTGGIKKSNDKEKQILSNILNAAGYNPNQGGQVVNAPTNINKTPITPVTPVTATQKFDKNKYIKAYGK